MSKATTDMPWNKLLKHWKTQQEISISTTSQPEPLWGNNPLEVPEEVVPMIKPEANKISIVGFHHD